MKKLFIFLLLSTLVFASNLDVFSKTNGFERDFETALNKAKDKNKILMVVLSADYCPWCRKFERKTLLNKDVKDYIDKNLITLLIDKTHDIDKFPKVFKADMTPTIFFIDPKTEKTIRKKIGYTKHDEFYTELTKASQIRGK